MLKRHQYYILLIFLFAIGYFITSCSSNKPSSLTFEKRKYTRGYYFEHQQIPKTNGIAFSNSKPKIENLKIIALKPINKIIPQTSSSDILYNSSLKQPSTGFLFKSVSIISYSSSLLFPNNKVFPSDSLVVEHKEFEKKRNNGLIGFIFTIVTIVLSILLFIQSKSDAIINGFFILFLFFLALIVLATFIISIIYNIKGLNKKDKFRTLAIGGVIFDLLVLLGALIGLFIALVI